MLFRTSGLQPRPWIYAWLLLLVPVWAWGILSELRMLRWVRADQAAMCRALPDYAAVSGLLPPQGPVLFLTEVPDPGNWERFFCAQHDLAPRVLVRSAPVAAALGSGPLAGRVLLLHFADPAARDAFLRDLAAEAGRQGAAVRRRDAGELVVLAVGKD